MVVAQRIDEGNNRESGDGLTLLVQHPVKSCDNSEGKMSSSSDDRTPEISSAIARLTVRYPEIPRKELRVGEQLGAGSFGSVYKGVWTTSSGQTLIVALKKVFMLEKEVDILSQIRHRNIIQFFGVSHANPDFYIVTEFAENGSLYEYLHNASAEMSIERILKWATQIAHGVCYLHYEAPTTIIHRDLKSKNVVIGHKMTCKLCDFGTSKDLTHSRTAPTWGGTAAWMSPEIISQKEGITTATDVWSYAVLLWEMFTREIPYNGLTEFKIYSIISQHGVRLVIPESCPSQLADLLRKCWQLAPKDRPGMREVVSCLEHMKGDKDVQRECAHFVENKEEWLCKINDQLKELDELKLDLARRMEELDQREKALRKRENSQRNFWNMIDIGSVGNPTEWDFDMVCSWVEQLAAEADAVGIADIKPETIDKIICAVVQYEISGSRLLKVGETDLERLGIENVAVRRFIVSKIDELRARCEITSDFPSLETAALIDARNKQDKSKTPFDYSIILHVGLYNRMMDSSGKSSYRFKVFMDSDWQERKPTDSVPIEIHDAATVIKDVCISMTTSNKSVLLETVRCICPPFGYLEWVDVDEESLPVNVTLAVTYTDQVIQPRNTRINLRIEDPSHPQTLCTKAISLKIRPVATDTSLSRISSSLFNNSVDKSPPPTNLQGVWRSRRRSFGASEQSLFLRSPQVWPDFASAIRKTSQNLEQQSKSADPQTVRRITKLIAPNLTKRSTSYIPTVARSPPAARSPPVANNTAIQRSPLSLQSRNLSDLKQVMSPLQLQKKPPLPQNKRRSRTKSEADSEQQNGHESESNFYLDSKSPSPTPSQNGTPDFKATSPVQKNKTSKQKKTPTKQLSWCGERKKQNSAGDHVHEDTPVCSTDIAKDPPNRCCENNCRNRKKIPLPKEEVELCLERSKREINDDGEWCRNGTDPDKKPKKKKNKKPTPKPEDTIKEERALNNSPKTVGGQPPENQFCPSDPYALKRVCSQKFYGGFDKLRWKR
ncbi:protein tyrosine kinase domain-containing protein [Ditylenchus destructor]|uniref:Protein tyrosine kinase domain-containing protein n=1 Tax=Ditylenchus destructor TaxID=166010 RepID=A0AAD4NAN1_9BILA|nr:protein tyrosine kinase domain-containing protein [Ditylenchus destructor]